MAEKISHLYKTSVKVILDLWIVKDESSKTCSMYGEIQWKSNKPGTTNNLFYRKIHGINFVTLENNKIATMLNCNKGCC